MNKTISMTLYLTSYTEVAEELKRTLKSTNREKVRENTDAFKEFVEDTMNKMEIRLFKAFDAGEITREEYEDITKIHDKINEDYNYIVMTAEKGVKKKN
jgi:protein-arginine kinase activator protein McsA